MQQFAKRALWAAGTWPNRAHAELGRIYRLNTIYIYNKRLSLVYAFFSFFSALTHAA